jgi:hypothetical protein
VAAIALALAYEMISGTCPTKLKLSGFTSGPRLPSSFSRRLYHIRWHQGRHLDRFDSSLNHDWERVNCACIALLRNSGGWHEIVQRHGAFQVSDLITTGLGPAKHGWDKVKSMFETEY